MKVLNFYQNAILNHYMNLIYQKMTSEKTALNSFLSAILNFSLALYIFTPLPEVLTEIEKQELLNEQLSKMTLYSLGVILVPSMIFLGTLIFYAFKKINQLTGLTTDELLKTT